MLATPSFMLNPLRMNCLNTALSLEAASSGMAQGELNGMVSSLGVSFPPNPTYPTTRTYTRNTQCPGAVPLSSHP